MTAGTCRFCRCPGEECKVAGGDLCGWMDGTRTVCTGPACQIAYFAEQRRKMAMSSRATRKRSPAEIHALIKEEKNAKQRAYRAKRKQQRGAA